MHLPCTHGWPAEPAPVQDPALGEAVARALQDRDWAARHLPRRPQLLPQLIQTVNDDPSGRGAAGR